MSHRSERVNPPEPLVWTPELVSRFWDGSTTAGLVDAWAFGRMAKRCVSWLIARHLVVGGRHLDYGAGGGEIAEYLIEQGYPFAVFEPSEERQLGTEARLGGLPGFLGGPGPERSQTFDVVTCFEVLEHVLDQDLDAACEELAGHVRPGGKLIVSTPNNEDLARDSVYCPVSNKVFHRWQHVRRIAPDWLIGQFACRGFRKVCLHQLDFDENLFSPYVHYLIPDRSAAGDVAIHPEDTGATGSELGLVARLRRCFGARQTRPDPAAPLHIHQIVNDIDGVMGGATRLLYVGLKQSETTG